jgi:hypothetical protein
MQDGRAVEPATIQKSTMAGFNPAIHFKAKRIGVLSLHARSRRALREDHMAARDILNLDNALAPRLIRCLYIVALVLITVMVVLGLVRGVRTMSRPPLPPPAMMGGAAPNAPAPDATASQPPQPGMMGPGQRRMMMDRRFGRPGFRGPRPMAPFGMGRNPVLAGVWIILGTLLRGAIGLMVVRILAEMGLAVLAMPRRSEI